MALGEGLRQLQSKAVSQISNTVPIITCKWVENQRTLSPGDLFPAPFRVISGHMLSSHSQVMEKLTSFTLNNHFTKPTQKRNTQGSQAVTHSPLRAVELDRVAARGKAKVLA